jgi:predicted permease
MFTAIAVLTLAIGIGANSAIFSVINGILLRPLPYPHSEKLLAMRHTAPGVKIDDVEIAPFLYFTYRDENRSFEDVGMWQRATGSVTGLAEPEEARCVDVTAGVLPLLGVQPAIGRWFSEAEDTPQGPQSMVLMYGWWQARLGGDRGVIGRKIMVDGIPREVIGVMPEGFQFLDREASFLLPMRQDRAKVVLGQFSFEGIARLKPGVTLEQANADVARMIPIAIDKFPPFPGFDKGMFANARLAPRFRPLKDFLVGDIGKTLWVLMGTLAIVLLIACANVANLLLVRADGRQHELAIRAALGAGFGQIAREMLAESVALGVMGGIAGLGIAYAAVRMLLAMAPANLPRLHSISIDPNVMAFTFGLALLTGFVFGLVPVFKYARPGGAGTLRAGGRTLSQSKERHRARSVLVVVQVALALVLLIGSGLMIRTFQALRHIQPGFTDPQDVLTFSIGIPRSQVKDPVSVVRLEQAILDKIAAIPGVSGVGLSSTIPTSGNGWHDGLYARDKTYARDVLPPLRSYKFISPGLLATTGTPLVAGRDFTWTDAYEKRPVAMVSDNLARELWGNPRNAIGKQVRETLTAPWHEVIGVVSDLYDDGVQVKPPTIVYWPLMVDNFEGNEVQIQRTLAYIVRSKRAGSHTLLNDVQQAVWSMNPNLPLANVRTLQEVYDRSLARTSFTLVMLAIAGAMALLIGLVGLYGVISYSVSQRTREIGIRMALGARQGELTRMFVRHGFVLAATGVACGLAAAVGVTRVLGSFLYHVNPLDPLTFAGVAAGLIAAAVFASYVPALRATAVDPVDALRAE